VSVTELVLQFPKQFCDQLLGARREREHGYMPSAECLQRALEAAFWASLKPDEGRFPAFAVGIDECPNSEDLPTGPGRMHLTPFLTFDASALAKFGVATAPRYSAVLLGDKNGELSICGLDFIKSTRIRIEIRGPAALLIKVDRRTVGVVSDRSARIIPEEDWLLLVAKGNPGLAVLLEEAADVMYALRHGGTVAVVPRFEEAKHVMQIQNSVQTYTGLAENEETLIEEVNRLRDAKNELRHAKRKLDNARLQEDRAAAQAAVAQNEKEAAGADKVISIASTLRPMLSRALAQPTAVDGAVVVGASGEFYGFGAKIKASKGPLMLRTRAIGNQFGEPIKVEDFHGTRHQSAARLVAEVDGARAIVASQDGKLSVLYAEDGEVRCVEHIEWMLSL
jgi:hypothetical protein